MGISADGDFELTGATDGTNIGNLTDRLKVYDADVVAAIVALAGASTPPAHSVKYRTVTDLSTVVLSASYQTVFNYNGSGLFVGFTAGYEVSGTIYRLTIDSNVIFSDIDGTDIALLMIDKAATESSAGGPVVSADGKRIHFWARYPIRYATNVKIEAQEATSKRHFRIMVNLTKET